MDHYATNLCRADMLYGERPHVPHDPKGTAR
jgi:hypothetical protein